MTLWSEAPSSSSLTQQYTEEDKALEQKLLPYDILGNLAHVKMLEKQGYLKEEELEDIEKALKDIYGKEQEVDAEDVHTFVEEKVTAYTEAGKKDTYRPFTQRSGSDRYTSLHERGQCRDRRERP